MKIAFNPSTVAALTAPPNNKDIIFDLRGNNIFARGVKFQGTDTNTWRDIKINGVSIGSNTLDLCVGENITFINNTYGKVTINSTWRPVVNNLNSNFVTKSLSAKQGKVLAELINTLDTKVSDNYALRDGSNATGRWQGGLACLDERNTIYTPYDLDIGLELHMINNNTNNLKDGGSYNGVFSFRPWGSGSDWTGGKAHQLSFTDNENIWHRTSSGDDSWGTWKKLAYTTDIPSSLKNPHALTISLNGISQGPYDGSAVKDINITPGSIGAATSSHTHTWASITDKIVSTNEFNIVDAGFNSSIWFNYKPINGGDSPATIDGYHFCNGNKGYTFLEASGFIKPDSTNSYVLLGGGGHKLESALDVANADTLDGEHASSFVRAGHYGSKNLNELDAYTFIRSVLSRQDNSPKGVGYYNVIQAVHSNLASGEPNYISQIALGIVPKTKGMFYRVKINNSWDNWEEVVTTNTGLLRYSRNNINISSSNCSPIPPSLLEWTIGYPRLYDPEFNEGYNNVQVYNNANNGVVTVTRVSDTNVGNSSNFILKVVSAVGAIPHCGGWHVSTQTELGKVYTCLFRASIPSGVEIDFNTNSIGTGGQWSWLTSYIGTGKWTWYAAQVYCGSEGSTTFYFATMSPCTWYLSYVNVIENNRASYAGLRSVYSDYLKANAGIVFERNELQYFNQYTSVTSGATSNANPTADWHHILRMNHANSSGYFVDLAIPFNDNRIQFRRIVSGSDVGWYRVITEEPNHNILLCDSSAGGNVGIGTTAPTQKLDVVGNIRASGQIVREGSGQMWVNGRKGALLRETSVSGYHTLWSLKTTDGSWDFGEFNHGNDWNNVPVLSYITDSDYNSGNNAPTYQIKFPLASGTVALTSNIPHPSNYYWANVKISIAPSTTTSPTVSTLTATSSIKTNNISLENDNEINSKGILYVNYANSNSVILCRGGGSVGIGITSPPAYKLDVNGDTRMASITLQAEDTLYYKQPICIACGYVYDGPELGTNKRIQKISCNRTARVELLDSNGKYRVWFPGIVEGKYTRTKMSLQVTGCPGGQDTRGVVKAVGITDYYGDSLAINVWTSDDETLNPSSFYFALWSFAD